MGIEQADVASAAADSSRCRTPSLADVRFMFWSLSQRNVRAQPTPLTSCGRPASHPVQLRGAIVGEVFLVFGPKVARCQKSGNRALVAAYLLTARGRLNDDPAARTDRLAGRRWFSPRPGGDGTATTGCRRAEQPRSDSGWWRLTPEAASRCCCPGPQGGTSGTPCRPSSAWCRGACMGCRWGPCPCPRHHPKSGPRGF